MIQHWTQSASYCSAAFQLAAASDVGPQLAPALSYLFGVFKVSICLLVVFLTTICFTGDFLLREVTISSSIVYFIFLAHLVDL